MKTKSHPASNLKNLIGERFHKLLVINREPNDKRGRARWLCQCECGNKTISLSNPLKTGHKKSCGCLILTHTIKMGRENRLRPFEWAYRVMCRSVKNRPKEFDITYEQFLDFTKIKECHYCGEDVEWNEYCTGKDHGTYKLDRKDNSRGYTMDNCVVCCPICNYMKQTLGYDTFIERCKKISIHHS